MAAGQTGRYQHVQGLVELEVWIEPDNVTAPFQIHTVLIVMVTL
jgi:hypothetical protein